MSRFSKLFRKDNTEELEHEIEKLKQELIDYDKEVLADMKELVTNHKGAISKAKYIEMLEEYLGEV